MRKVSLSVIIVLLATVGFAQSLKDSTTNKDSILPFQSQDLKEVKVTARKKLIEQKIDKTVINVDAAISNTGTSALEVLEKTPGVTIDKDGNISLKGKQGVTVMLDGRPTYMSGQELASMLRGMESSQLDQIEIMTNPPAKYDAAGNSGIINIKTKKNKNTGFSGSVTAGITQGKYFRTNESVSLNYKSQKINLFSTYSFNGGKGFRELDIYRRYTNDDNSTKAIFDQVAVMNNKRANNNLKLGMDYYLTKKTTIGIVLSGFSNPEYNNGKNTSYLKNPAGVVDSILVSNSKMDEFWKNGSINLNMRHVYDTSGREITADIDIIAYDINNDQYFKNISYTPEMIKRNEDNLHGDLPMTINIYSAKADYVHPFKNKLKLEAGWKSSYVITDSKSKYYIDIDGELTPDYTKTNFFRYRENVNAAYVNLHKKLNNKFDLQTGLRFENTNYNGLQHGNPTRTDSSFNKTYNSLFPTAYLTYTADKDNQFAVSLGRRIDRPRYEDLNPFLYFIDRYTYGKGNPYLRPQYANNAELSHTFKGVLTTTLNYSYTRNLISETFDQIGDYTTVQSNGNYGKRNNAGIAISYQFTIKKWLSSNVFGNYNYTKLESKLFGDDFKTEGGSFIANMNNQFSFGKGWNAELSGWYQSRGIEGQLILYSMGAITTGVAKQLMDSRATVKLTFRDIFYTQPVKGEINFKATETKFRSLWDSRQVNLTITYRFGKKLTNTPLRNKSIEEQKRVKGAAE